MRVARLGVCLRTMGRSVRFVRIFGEDDSTLYRRCVWTNGSELCLIKCCLRTVEFGMHIYKLLKYTNFTTHEVAQQRTRPTEPRRHNLFSNGEDSW